MPNPITGQPWPWEPQPQAQAAAPDTSARDALRASLVDANGGLKGEPSPVTIMGTGAQANTPLNTGYSLYTFANGASIEINDKGESRNWKAPPAQTAAQQQQATGTQDFGANGVWVKGADGVWGPSVDTQNKQQLAGAQTVAQTGVYQGQGNLYNQQAGVVGSNATAQQGLQNAQAGLYGAQAGVVGSNAQAQQTLQNAQAGLYGQQAGVVGSNAAAQQQLQGAQSGLYGAQAGVVQSNALAQQNLQGAQANLYGTQAQLAPVTAQAQAAQGLAQANLYGQQANVVQGNALAQQNLYGAQAANQQAQAAAAMNPAQLTVNLTNQANQMAGQLHQQAASGKISGDQAASQFNDWYSSNIEPMKQQIAYQQAVQQQALQTQGAQAGLYQAQAANYPAALAQLASSDAQKNAVSMMPYLVNSGAASNPGITAGKGGFPQINPGQVMQNAMFSVPNLQEIGRQGAAAALANISPTAAMHAQMPGPPGQPPVQGLPDLSSMLNMNNYGFGPPGGATPPMAGQPAPVAAAPAAPAPYDWTGLLARQQQSAAEQAQQAQIPWGTYQPSS
jgi:hypothetical protein